ncbi:N-acetyl-gamma-glutamyl-phosphate reductase [Nitrosophilus alvini]|uniref:N-acetyl-gamma-glutamyl-phosphate reductase n=1 Tax=Nitrosophilus alvini TaxID=2714855 RepID=UPI00190E0179|nr:N-acetyl-gamma-glutamyl-phosphate reductase [Nitrosophilus alvini]
MIRCAIVGASGYTGLELIKILLNHPKFEISYLATSEGGEDIETMHPAFKEVFAKSVEKADAKEIAKRCDLAFLALPHKTSMGFAKELLDLGVRVVDLSADYRLSLENYEKYYCPHIDKKHLKDAVYGLPEFYRQNIESADLVANPGCYPTAALLAIVPFLPYLESSHPLIIDAKSGVSGAGKKCTQKTHYVTINENIFAYNPIKHRHSIEIKEKAALLAQEDFDVTFVPHLLPITRGMLVSCYATLKKEIDANEILEEFYADEIFVRVRETLPDVKSVSGTNFCDIFSMANGKTLFVSSAIDNLLRGASAQAVVNANIMHSFPEDLGIPKIAYVP